MVSGTIKRGTPSVYQKNHLNPIKKQSQRVSHLLNPGLVRAHRLSASLLALRGRSRRPAKPPPHARPCTGGLDGELIFRLARGPARKASDEMPILRLARSRLGNNSSLLPRPGSPTERHVPLMRQPLPQSQSDDGSTPQSGQWDKEWHQRHTN